MGFDGVCAGIYCRGVIKACRRLVKAFPGMVISECRRDFVAAGLGIYCPGAIKAFRRVVKAFRGVGSDALRLVTAFPGAGPDGLGMVVAASRQIAVPYGILKNAALSRDAATAVMKVAIGNRKSQIA